jgi:hypothetical protein
MMIILQIEVNIKHLYYALAEVSQEIILTGSLLLELVVATQIIKLLVKILIM